MKLTKLLILLLFLSLKGFSQTTISPTLTVIAGTGTQGSSGDLGLATAAEINYPSAVTVNKNNGDIYFTEFFLGTVRKIEHSTGIITTIAGAGTDQSDGILAIDSRLTFPTAILIDHSGRYLYIGQSSDARIRRIDLTSGIIATIAGTGVAGYSGDLGLATAAKIGDNIYGIVEDNLGNIYFSDVIDFMGGNSVIRKIDHTSGIITTIAGTGTGGYTGDNGPAINAKIGVIVNSHIDNDNNLFLPDFSNFVIRKVNLNTGIITTIAGTGVTGYSGDGRLATITPLDGPTSVSSDATGNIYISDFIAGSIRKIDRNGIITTIAETLPNNSNFIDITKDIDNNLIIIAEQNSIIGKLSIGITPSISLSNPSATLTSNCAGVPSAHTTFGVNGSGLTTPVIISAASNFEISTSSSGSYSSSLTLPQASSVSQTVYIRLSSSASTNGANGIITANSSDLTPATTTVSSTTVVAPLFTVTGPYTICSEGTYAVSLTVANSYNGWSTSSNAITVNSSGYVTAGTVTGTYSVSYSDACAQIVSATVTVAATSNLPAITDGLASYKFNNNPQGPIGSGNVIYVGYNGFNYSSTIRPTNTGFYRANNVSGSSAGSPTQFYIFRCTTCGTVSEYTTRPQGSLSGNTVGTGQLTYTSSNGGGPFTIVYQATGGSPVTVNNISSTVAFNVVTPTITTSYKLISVTDEITKATTDFSGTSASITVPPPHYVGESFGGGIVFYVDANNHGLIAASSDEVSTLNWADAINACNNKIIDVYFDDWYLPSKDELDLMYLNRGTIGFGSGYYWSSTEFNSSNAYYRRFARDFSSYAFKGTVYFVRAIRSF